MLLRWSRIAVPALTLVALLGCGGTDAEVAKARGLLASRQPDVALTLLGPLLVEEPSNPLVLAAVGDAYLLQALDAGAAGNREGATQLAVKAFGAWKSAASQPEAPCVALERLVSMQGLAPAAAVDLPPLDDARLVEIVKKCGPGDYLAQARERLSEAGRAVLGEVATWTSKEPKALPTFRAAPEPGLGFTVTAAEPIQADAVDPNGPANVEPFRTGVVADGGTAERFHFADAVSTVSQEGTGWIPWKKEWCGFEQVDPRWLTTSYGCRGGAPGGGVASGDVLDAGLRSGDRMEGLRCTGEVGVLRDLGFYRLAKCAVRFDVTRSPVRSLPATAAVFHPASMNGRGAHLAEAAAVLPRELIDELAAGRASLGVPWVWAHRALVPECGASLQDISGFDGEAVVRTCTVDDVRLTFVDGVLRERTGGEATAAVTP